MTVLTAPSSTWTDVCPVDHIVPNRGVCALVGGVQVAVFRVAHGGEEQVLAVSNFDPFSRAFVLSRGIVGSTGGRLKVASPVYKQGFDLRTGECLDDASVRVPTFPARVIGGRVQIRLP